MLPIFFWLVVLSGVAYAGYTYGRRREAQERRVQAVQATTHRDTLLPSQPIAPQQQVQQGSGFDRKAKPRDIGLAVGVAFVVLLFLSAVSGGAI